MHNAIFAQGIEAAQKHLANRGYTLLFSTTEYEPRIEYEQARNMLERAASLLALGNVLDVHEHPIRRDVREAEIQVQLPTISPGHVHLVDDCRQRFSHQTLDHCRSDPAGQHG